MNRVQKEALVEQMRHDLDTMSLVIVAKQSGLTVGEVSELRRSVRQADAHFKVCKNTLARLAVQGSKVEGLKEYLKGPTVLAYAKDPVGIAKILVKFSKDNEKLTILGGALDGVILSQSDLGSLATLPSLNELRSQMIAIITAPATKIARIALEPAAQLARLASAYGRK